VDLPSPSISRSLRSALQLWIELIYASDGLEMPNIDYLWIFPLETSSFLSSNKVSGIFKNRLAYVMKL